MTTTSSTPFLQYAETVRPLIDAALDDYAEFGSDCPEVLQQAIRHSLLAPGKRLRPILVLMAAEACGRNAEEVMPAACAVEMVHTYSLIHDDLPSMDNDLWRRGRPSCHAKFGEATAILAGDALLAYAFEVLGRDLRPVEIAGRCCSELARAAGATAMVGGQVDDLAGSGPGCDETQLEHVHRRKTGAMICVSLRLGALAASADTHELAMLEAYGQDLGLAFQIVDDLLDVKGCQEQVGKTLGKDQQQGKVTFPTLLGVDGSRQRAKQLVQDAQSRLSVFQGRAEPLASLAWYVWERDY